MKTERTKRFEKEPQMETNVFVLTELPQGKPSTGSIEILSRGLASKFDQVTVIDASAPEVWDNLKTLSQDAANYFLANPMELAAAKPLVTVAFFTWETTRVFIDELILYGQELNPLVEELLICDMSSLLCSHHGREIQTRMAKAGILQNCYEGFAFKEISERVMSKSISQQKMRAQSYEPIFREINRLNQQGKK